MRRVAAAAQVESETEVALYRSKPFRKIIPGMAQEKTVLRITFRAHRKNTFDMRYLDLIVDVGLTPEAGSFADFLTLRPVARQALIWRGG